MSNVLNEIKKYALKNNYTILFSALALIFLIFGIFSATKLNLSWNFLNQVLSIFPTLFWFLFFISFVGSFILAYYEKYKWMVWPIFIVLLIFTIYVRTSNIPQLKDVVTGEYTLGPDLDPFLYLRNAKEILTGTNTGKIDNMRYMPFGAPSYLRSSLMPWTIVWLYKGVSIFSNISLTYAAIIAPVLFFSISLIGFFLFTNFIFLPSLGRKKSKIAAILASFFYAFAPQMLHRTTAGIPEIESLGMAFFWFAFLFFSKAWKTKENKKIILFGALGGLFAGLMSFSWGGYRYLHMIIGLTTLVLFVLDKNRKKNFLVFSSWAIVALVIDFIRLKNISSIINNISGPGFTAVILLLLIFHEIISKLKIKKLKKIKIPDNLKTISILLIIAIIISLIINPKIIVDIISKIIEGLLFPFGRSRVGITIAENSAPFFKDAISQIGYLIWIFLISSFLLFSESIKGIKKDNKRKLLISFFLFLCSITFTRISSTSIMNGDNFISQFIFIVGIIQFGIVFLWIFIKSYKENKNFLEEIKKIKISYVLLLAFSFWAIISIRGAVRLFFIISPMVILIVSYFPLKIFEKIKRTKDELIKFVLIVLIILTVIILISSFMSYSKSTIAEAGSTIPRPYDQQWQKAMNWVKENTPERATFVHWWDYGYWVQTLGERPTVTDGGHYLGFWDHLVGRYVLTSTNPDATMSFMKSHNVSYLLIDSTDIGKYSAYSSIGSNSEDKDRFSWLPTLVSNKDEIQETRNGSIIIYHGGSVLDSDLIYNSSGEEILLPAEKAGIGAIIIEIYGNSLKQPEGVFVYNGQQIKIPIRYVYIGGQFIDFESGVNSLVYIFPKLDSSSQTGNLDRMGAAMYLSEKVKDGLFAQLYLMDDPNNLYPTFELAHSQSDPVVEYLKVQGFEQEFVYYSGVRGPIKIWKTNYPEDILIREEFLRTSGEYAEFDNLQFRE